MWSLLFPLLFCGQWLLLLFGGMSLWFLRWSRFCFLCGGRLLWWSMCFSQAWIFCTKVPSPFLTSLSQQVMPSELVPSHFLSRLLHVTRRIPAFNTNDSCKYHPMALRLMDSLTCSPVVYCISRNQVTAQWSGPSNEALSDLRVCFHLKRCHPTCAPALGLFPEPALKPRVWQI